MTADARLQRYAELAVRVGANVQPGQDVVVMCLVEHAEIARAVVRESYRAGAKHVIVNYGDVTAEQKIAFLEANPAFANVDAVKNDRYVVLEYVEATPGPRNIRAVEYPKPR